MKLMRTCLLVLSVLVALVAGVDVSSQQPNGQKPQAVQKVTDSSSSSSDSDGAVGKAIIAGLDKAQNKRGAPVIPTTIVGTPQHAYINQPVAAAGSLAGASVGQVAYTSYGHPHFHHQAGAISSSATLNAGGHQQHLVQQSGAAAVAAPQAVFHKINYVAPNSALKVATFSAAPAHYEYGPAVAPTLTKYNYAAAVPQQYQYAHYPQQTIQVYQHHHPHQAPAATATIITNAAGQLQYLHHPQQQAATIYTAHQPAAAVHYTLTQPAVQQSVGQQAQAGTIHYHHAHQPQHPQQTTFVGVQPSVPVVHQAPIAAINQVHQANQVIAAQAQLVKYPLPTASPIYATNAVQNHLYQQQSANYGSYAVPVAAKQYLSTVASPTVATPSNIKQLIPVTTATTTQHHGKGVSYSTFTQQANPASLGHQQNQSPYYNTVIAQHYQQQQQQQQQQSQAQQQQQQPPAARFQVYSTLATPLQKPQVLYAAHQYAQPSIPAAIYATAASPFQQFQHQPQSSYPHYGSQFFHPQPPQQQQQLQPYAQLAKIAYNPGAASLQKGYYPVQ